jgi:hypothetical protein
LSSAASGSAVTLSFGVQVSSQRRVTSEPLRDALGRSTEQAAAGGPARIAAIPELQQLLDQLLASTAATALVTARDDPGSRTDP